MSQPKRYFLKISQTISGLRCETYEADNGEYVDYSAYAALQAENERLRKAGEAMCDNIPRMVTCQVTAHEAVKLRDAWLAAKGVQS